MARRFYSSVAKPTTLSNSVGSGDTSLTVGAVLGWPVQFPYTVAIDRGTASEELLSVTAVTGSVLTVIRAQDGTGAVSHTAGAVVEHVSSARDLEDAGAHIAATSNIHGVTGAFVDTASSQTLTNKTLTSPTITGPAVTGGTFANPTVSGATLTGTTTAGPVNAQAVTATTVAATGAVSGVSFAATADVTARGRSLPAGGVGWWRKTTSVGPFSNTNPLAGPTPAGTVLVTAPFTALTGRTYRVTATFRSWQSSVAGDTVMGATLRLDGTPFTEVNTDVAPILNNSLDGRTLVGFISPAAGARVVTFTGHRQVGTGNITVIGTTEAPISVFVEDIGPAITPQAG